MTDCIIQPNKAKIFDLIYFKMTSAVGFDSDCIDLRLSGPGSGDIDHDSFPDAENQRQFLKTSDKKFVLTQPPHVRYVPNDEYKQVIKAE